MQYSGKWECMQLCVTEIERARLLRRKEKLLGDTGEEIGKESVSFNVFCSSRKTSVVCIKEGKSHHLSVRIMMELREERDWERDRCV